MPEQHKNPAEHCRAIGIEVGKEGHDKIKASDGSRFTVLHVGSNKVVVEDGHEFVHTIYSERDITAWTKVEPVPVVTIHNPCGGVGFEVYVERENSFGVAVYGNAVNRFGSRRALELCRIGADAIKSAIEADLGKPADAGAVADGPYTISSDGINHWVDDHRKRQGLIIVGPTFAATEKFGKETINEICEPHARQIASELNRLHARQPK